MSEGKHDRSTAPRGGTRASRAKQDRTIKPPAFKFTKKVKPKKGARVMEAQLAAKPEPVEMVPAPLPEGEQPPPSDPWWNAEREKVYAMVLQGIPQHQIAGELARDRHTIGRWIDDERFVERLMQENQSRFHSMRQRRAMQTVRITDKVERIADKLLTKTMEDAEKGLDDMKMRFAARDWLSEFREMSRREDEVYGLDKQRVDVHHHGQVQHTHRRVKDISFKDFLHGAMKKMGVDVNAEEIDATRADEALIAITEKALMEGSFLDDLVESEKQEQLQPLLAAGSER